MRGLTGNRRPRDVVQYILGEAPEVRNFFVAAGFNSSGIASAAGAGKALSEWLIQVL